MWAFSDLAIFGRAPTIILGLCDSFSSYAQQVPSIKENDFSRITLMNHKGPSSQHALDCVRSPTNFIFPGLAEGPPENTVSFTCRDNFEFRYFLHFLRFSLLFFVYLHVPQYNSLTFASSASLRLSEAMPKFFTVPYKSWLLLLLFTFNYLLFIISFPWF